MSCRGFGIAGSLNADLVAPLAEAAEKAGFSSFWANDTPGADSLAVLQRAAAVTSSIRLGVGVIPLDRRPATAMVDQIAGSEIPQDRLIIGVGSGATLGGSLNLVQTGVKVLRGRGFSVAVGALGDRMVDLAAEHADAVLLNWLTPEWAARSAERVRRNSRKTGTEVIGYVRTGLTASVSGVQAEADRYTGLPQYGRHFQNMGVRAIDTGAVGSPVEIGGQLERFDEVLDETVVRAIVVSESLDDYLQVIEAGKPRR
ncbi:hypothetical protein BH23CHL5_BH23CHL5_16450 [soil metagenome]